MSALEDALALQLRAARIKFEREVRFAPPRRFRLDFVLPHRLAIEVQGGVWTRGAHSRGAGQAIDAEKGYLALLNGYRILYLTTDHIKSGVGLRWIEELMYNLMNGGSK